MTYQPAQLATIKFFQRTPKRISITIPFAIHHELIERSNYEGRSISNLAAFLLEQALEEISKKMDLPRKSK